MLLNSERVRFFDQFADFPKLDLGQNPGVYIKNPIACYAFKMIVKRGVTLIPFQPVMQNYLTDLTVFRKLAEITVNCSFAD